MTACSTPETICVQCGDKGFANAFVYCIKCINVSVHRYCLNVIPSTVDEFVQWVCDDCGVEVQNQFVGQCKTKDHSTYCHAQVPERNLDGNFGRHNMLFEDNNIQNIEQAQEINFVRSSLAGLRTQLVLYNKFDICTSIMSVLSQRSREDDRFIYGDALPLFRRHVLGYLLEFKGGNVSRRAVHAMLCRQVRVSDHTLEVREINFYVSGTLLLFRAADFNLVTGLRFGSSNFDPNAPVDIPQKGIFYRLFQGKRILVKDVRMKFETGALKGYDPADLAKVSSILMLYYMIFCFDNLKKHVDDWVWALVENDDQWNTFPWGAYSFQILMHFISILPEKRSDFGGTTRDGTYHFFGPSWVLQAWMVEVIPQLVGTILTRTGGVNMPRCLKWASNTTNVDFVPFFDGEVQLGLMIPSPDEVEAPYFYRGGGDPLGVKYISPKKRSKKKIVESAARVIRVPMTCVDTTADAIDPSSSGGMVRRSTRNRHSVTVTQLDIPLDLAHPEQTATRQTKRHREKSNNDRETSLGLFERITKYVDTRCQQTERYIDKKIEELKNLLTSSFNQSHSHSTRLP